MTSILTILLFLLPLFSHSEEFSLKKRHFGDYQVEIGKFYGGDYEGRLVIRKGKKIVFREHEIGGYYYFGNQTDGSIGKKDAYFRKSITGSMIPSLVITKWTAGAHCCNYLYVFELGENLKKIITVDAQSSPINLIDLDHDGIPEIEFWDGSIDYLFASFAFSPKGHVILKYADGEYNLAAKLMQKKSPSRKHIEKMRSTIRNAFTKKDSPDLPYDFLRTLMDLSYSGHIDLALKLADETWPSPKTGLSEFKENFQEALRSSPYWKNL